MSDTQTISMKSRITQDIGEASMCWTPIPEGVFDSQRAAKIAEALATDVTDLLEAAWGIIANAHGGNWDLESKEWQDAAIRWRDRYHATLEHND